MGGVEQEGYAAPRSIAEAVALLESSNGGDARVLAGGTDLLVQMRSWSRCAPAARAPGSWST
jgi:CO/xanthine dehydrogenase FAD-binding subunit